MNIRGEVGGVKKKKKTWRIEVSSDVCLMTLELGGGRSLRCVQVTSENILYFYIFEVMFVKFTTQSFSPGLNSSIDLCFIHVTWFSKKYVVV